MRGFLNWLFHWDTNPLWTAMFVSGAAMISLFVLALLFVLAWPIGVLALFSLIFGPPYLAYRKAKKDE